MDGRSEEAKRDVRPPHPVVATGRLERLAALPRAEEAADLVREDDEAEKRREVSRAMQLCHQAYGRWHRREIGEADDRCKYEEHERCLRREKEDEYRDRA